MHRFFSSQPLTELLVIKEGAHFHQILNVFRAKKGERVIFFESGGDDIVYEIITVSKKQIEFAKRETIQKTVSQTKKKHITVFQSFPNKISTMETIVQKMVEIGVDHLIFFSAERSQIREIPTGKMMRITSIAQEALEQSGGNKPLMITYSDQNVENTFLKFGQNMQHIMGYPGGGNSLQIDKACNEYSLWIGPEGGWSENEVSFFKQKECLLWTFNERILRLETASIIGAGILSYSL